MHQSTDSTGRGSYYVPPSDAIAHREQRAHLDLFKVIAQVVERRGFHPTHAKHLLYFLIMDSPLGKDFCRRAADSGSCEAATTAWVEAALSSAVGGKRFVELGCRSGFTLRLLREYGAQHVFGITSSDYAPTARNLLGADAVSIAHVTDMPLILAAYARLQRPDIVLNCGLLDSDRTNAPTNSRERLFRALYHLNALNYVIGSVNGYQQSQLTLDHFPQSNTETHSATRTCESLDWSNRAVTLAASDFLMHLPPGSRSMAPTSIHPHRRDTCRFVVGFRFRLSALVA